MVIIYVGCVLAVCGLVFDGLPVLGLLCDSLRLCLLLRLLPIGWFCWLVGIWCCTGGLVGERFWIWWCVEFVCLFDYFD